MTLILTPSDRRALTALSLADYLTPSELGYASVEPRAKGDRVMRSQGAGRIGGRKAKRLVKAGLVEDCSFKRGGFPAYRITAQGRGAQ